MRIDGWQVDGFGVLKDFERRGLQPGVTVLLGENEAGKSTLLAFLRAVLFGFPDGRSRVPTTYEPVFGGRHGGRLFVRDADDGLWTLQRYADERKTVGVTRPDGSAGSPADLTALLGGADGQLFRNVFAFGLDELQAFETLSDESVSERIFDAGISGAGRSAREVMRKLQQRQEELLKQRGGKALLNDLVREINDKDRQEREARDLVGQYRQLQREERDHTKRAEELRVLGKELLRRRSDLATLVELQPQWRDKERKLVELAGLPRTEDENLPAQVSGLVTELAGLRALEQTLPDKEQSRAAEQQVQDQALAQLGPDWDIDRAAALDASVATRDQVRGWAAGIDAAEQALHDADRERVGARNHLSRCEQACERARSGLPEAEPLSVDEIERQEELLRRLGDRLSTREKLQLLAEQQRPAAAFSRMAVTGLAAVALIACIVVLVLGYVQLGIGLAVAAVLLVVVAVIVSVALRPPRPSPKGTERLPAIGQVDADVADLAGRLGLPASPAAADLGELEARLSSERMRCSEWHNAQKLVEAADHEVRTAWQQMEEADAAHAAATEGLQRIDDQWKEWLGGRGLDELSPGGVEDVLRLVGEAVTAHGRLVTVSSEIDQVAGRARVWEETARSLLTVAGRPDAGLGAEALRAEVERLDQDLDDRAQLRREVDQLERSIAVSLGSCTDHKAAEDELDCGSPEVWKSQIAELDEQLQQADTERDEALQAARSAHDQIHALESSVDIPRLQEEREGLRAELAGLAQEYRVVCTAHALIAGTLKTYVMERQPEVLEAGGRAFSALTNGRYLEVRQEEGDDIQSVVVVSSDGRQLKPAVLSKGTQQQLYLAIRLALVEEFGRRSQPLPLIMDDCLVNFDPRRAAAVAALLAERSAVGQCLLFTCHPETADLMGSQTAGPVTVIEMPRAVAPEGLEGQATLPLST